MENASPGMIPGKMMHDERDKDLLGAVAKPGVDISFAALDVLRWDGVTSVHGPCGFRPERGTGIRHRACLHCA